MRFPTFYYYCAPPLEVLGAGTGEHASGFHEDDRLTRSFYGSNAVEGDSDGNLDLGDGPSDSGGIGGGADSERGNTGNP